MYYSAIGLLAAVILLIENQDILLNRNKAFEKPAWKVYRTFLYTVLVYYVTDILWGIIEANKIPILLFADTSVYFIAMAAGVFCWSWYVVLYLDENNGFGKFLVYAGRALAVCVAALTLVNIFVPVLFTVDSDCVYKAYAPRYAVLLAQILILLFISIYAFSSMGKRKNIGDKIKRYRTTALFGLIMLTLLIAQVLFTYLPFYSMAYMLGTCLLRAFVVGDEKEEYRRELIEAEKIKTLKASITALLDNMPALSFSKDADTGVYLACNQSFAEYAHKENPEGVVGLTDAEIFDVETAKHFVEDDRMAMSMDEPYIFFEDVPDAAGNQRQFQTTKLKYIDSTGRLCLLGMCQDVTDMVRVERENAKTKEAYEKARKNGIIHTHIAQTLASGYRDIFYVNVETGEFIEYQSDENTGVLKEKRSGEDFFGSCEKEAKLFVHVDDRETFIESLKRENLLDALDRNKTFMMTYRLIEGESSSYLNMKVSRMQDDERFIVIGVMDVDDEMRQRRAAERAKEEHIAYSRLNALAGDFLCVYVVNPETGRYREFSSTEGFETLGIPKEGMDFFEASRQNAIRVVHPDDIDRFLSAYTEESVLAEVERSGVFSLSYRLVSNGKPTYVQVKAAMVEESAGKRLIVGVNDIDLFVRQEEDYARRLEQAQNIAHVDALTGVKNRHAYLDKEAEMNQRIKSGEKPEFALVIFDVNDLKKINDSEGHRAGDKYLKDACKIICDTFKKSPVFRIGGDEFAVIAQGEDYLCVDELVEKMAMHNARAKKEGGIVIACGMSRYNGEGRMTRVFETADEKMYHNKNELKTEH